MASTQAMKNGAVALRRYAKHLNPGIVRLSDHILGETTERVMWKHDITAGVTGSGFIFSLLHFSTTF